MTRPPLLVAAATLLAACAPAPADERPLAERPVRIVATTGMVADLARQIGGDRVEVHGLMGPGVDPHLYRARESDVQRMVGADLILTNGLHLEGKLGDVLDQMRSRGVAVAAVAESVPDSLRLDAEGGDGLPDPHVWMDVARWAYAATALADALAALDPAHAGAYREREAATRARLDALHAEVRARIEAVPPARRVLVTAHDAFAYFGDAYGLEVRGLQGISTAAEAGTADVRALADFVVARGVPALFVESSVPPRSIEAVLAAIRARGADVRLGGSLYSDALGDAASGADTYEGMIRHNAATIADALGGPDA